MKNTGGDKFSKSRYRCTRRTVSATTLLGALHPVGLLRAASSAETRSDHPYPYAKPDGKYPEAAFIKDALRLHFGSAAVNRQHLFRGWDDEIIAYGMAPVPVNKDQLTDFYTAVFTEFPDFTLMDDALIVAGDMGAHRYHAMGTHTGGGAPTGQKIMFRGQTIYRINRSARVNWRISNHDHVFREAQIAYARQRHNTGAYRSWAPDPHSAERIFTSSRSGGDSGMPTETEIRIAVATLMSAASGADSRQEYWSHYQPDARIHGLVAEDPLKPMPLTALQSEYDELWGAAPDLRYATGELIVCGAYAIQQWFAWGTRADNGNEVTLREETIYRFDTNARIVERWINHDRDFAGYNLGHTARPGESKA